MASDKEDDVTGLHWPRASHVVVDIIADTSKSLTHSGRALTHCDNNLTRQHRSSTPLTAFILAEQVRLP